MKLEKQLNIGRNKRKGKEIPRLWIEGAALSSMGWNVGDEYWAYWHTTSDGRPMLVYRKEKPQGPTDTKPRKRKVAGTADRPIIDTVGDVLMKVDPLAHITILPSIITVVAFDETRHSKAHSTDGKRA